MRARAGTDTSDQVFAGMGDDDAGNLSDDLSNGSMPLGDVLHPVLRRRASPTPRSAQPVSGRRRLVHATVPCPA